MLRRRGGRARGPIVRGAVVGGALMLVSVAPGRAQPDRERKPVIPAGVPVVVLPVQSAHPTAGGAWPGGGATEAATLDRLAAELSFAFGETRGAEEWVMPDEVVDRARRNPIVQVDPARLAYHGLLGKPEKRAQLYEPLHGQLRRLASLFGARIVVLPLAFWYRPEPEEEKGAPAAGERPDGPGNDLPRARGRGVLLIALVDVRRSAVLWHGTIEGDPADPRSPALLATLAHRVAQQLSPS